MSSHRWKVFAALVAIMLGGSVCFAAGDDDDVLMTGLGVQTCGEFSSLFKENPQLSKRVVLAWAQGFLSGLNWAGGEPRGLPAAEHIWLRLNVYCDRHPLARVFFGLLETYKASDYEPAKRPR